MIQVIFFPIRPALDWLRDLPRFYCRHCVAIKEQSGQYRGCGMHPQIERAEQMEDTK